MISSREYHPPWDWMFCNISKFPRRFPCTVSSFASVMCHLLILPDSPQPGLSGPGSSGLLFWIHNNSAESPGPGLGPTGHFSSEPLSSAQFCIPESPGDNARCQLRVSPNTGPSDPSAHVRTPDPKQSIIRTRKLLPPLVTNRSLLHKIVLAKRIEIPRSNSNTYKWNSKSCLCPKCVAISGMQNGESH